MKRNSHNQGYSLIEALITISILLVVIVGFISAYFIVMRVSAGNLNKVKATLLAEEGLEAVRVLRDTNWNIATFNNGGIESDYYLYFNGTTWNATTTNIFVDNLFERKVVLDDVYRNASTRNIATTGTQEYQMRKVNINVSWRAKGATTTLTLSTYIANIHTN